MEKFFGIFSELIKNKIARPVEGYSGPEAKIYDSIQGSFNMEIPFYKSFLNDKKRNVLELGCGTGRLLIEFAKEGCFITGIDNSEDMINICREKSKKLSKKIQSNIEVINSDMGSYKLEKKYDLIIVVINTFQHIITINDKIMVLKTAKKHLNDNGYIIIDTQYLRESAPVKSNISCNLIKTNNNESLYMYQSDFDALTKIEKHNTLQIKFNNKKPNDVIVSSYYLRIDTIQEMESIVEKAGLHITNLYSNWKKEPVKNESRNIIYVLSK